MGFLSRIHSVCLINPDIVDSYLTVESCREDSAAGDCILLLATLLQPY